MWIPVEYKKSIRPLNYIKNPNDDTFIKEYGGSREYSRNNKGIFNINENIYLKDILISDEAKQKVYLYITLLKSEEKQAKKLSVPTRSIEIEAISYNNKKEIIFKENIYLKCIETNSNGIFQYEYEYMGKSFLLNTSFNIINAVYHCIKSFYHDHKYHDIRADAILSPFCSSKQISFNSALFHYMESYKEMFELDFALLKEYKDSLDAKSLKLNEESKLLNISRDKQKEIKSKRIKYLKNYHVLYEEHNKVLKKRFYYKALISSKFVISKSIEESNSDKRIKETLNALNQQKNKIKYLLNKKKNKPKLTEKGYKDFKPMLEELTSDVAKIKTLLIEAYNSEIKSVSRNKKLFWFSTIIALFLGVADYFYYHKSASKEDTKEINTKLDSIKVQLTKQQDSIIQIRKNNKESDNNE